MCVIFKSSLHGFRESKSRPRQHGEMSRPLTKWSSSFTRRCVAVAKEQRTRFYIFRKCVLVLLCWDKYGEQ
ncbi:Hexosyltransferase [Psidium guajava]|nr:Hexosyltransferase [Psidium guajava]